MKYLSGAAFRRALEQRLRTRSLQTGLPLVRLRKMVAFDRFLARLLQVHPDYWVVKGGLALQLRIGARARTTKDIDLLALLHVEEITITLRKAGSLDLGDWFAFEVAEPLSNSGLEPGGIRHAIQASLDSRTFEQFHLDVGIGDPLVDPVDYLSTPALLEFADLEPVSVPCYPITQQIAEKLHAYTRPRKTGESSRVKDFIDILLLAELGTISGERLFRAIQATFSIQGTHDIPENVPPTPANWGREYQRMADDVGLGNLSLEQSYQFMQDFLDPVLKGISTGWWDSAGRDWR